MKRRMVEPGKGWEHDENNGCAGYGCTPKKDDKMRLYVAGPMRGHDLYNFPTFDSAAAWLREDGYKIISPAELDRAVGFDPAIDDTITDGFVEAAMRRDVEALLKVDGVALLPGWEASAGVKVELAVARGLGLPVWELLGKKLGRRSETATSPAGPWIYSWSELRLLGEVAEDHTRKHGPEREAWHAVTAGPFPSPIRVTAPTGGQKESKPQQLHQIPVDFLLGLGEVYAVAQANKYPDVGPGLPNWSKGYPWSLSYSALQRHLGAFWKGQFLDPEDGLPHLLHAAWHCATLFTWHEEGIAPECDDRPAYLRPLAERDLYIDQAEADRIAAAPIVRPNPTRSTRYNAAH